MKNLFGRLWSFASIFLAISLWMPHGASAQGFGTISGTVLDTSGAAIPAATITLVDEKTGISQTSVAQQLGSFSFPSLNPSNYKISISASGFKEFQQSAITLQANQTVTVNARLQVGSTSETISVVANPVQVDTVTGTLSQVVEQATVNEMPLNGRNAASLTTLVAGVVVSPNGASDQGNTKTFPVVVTVTTGGSRVGQTNYMLDGGNNVDEYTNVNDPFPFPDALQEFSVQTSNYSAEYGQNAGGVVNLVTKSGGEKYHGDLFEFVRNRAFNAANYFSYPNGIKTVDPLKRNQFGGTVGGPFLIPRLFNPGKSFFFTGWQTTIIHTIATSSAASVLPTTAQLAGTFSGTKCIVNPLQPAHTYPCTQTGSTSTTTVNTADYSPVSLALLKYLPSGGASGAYTLRKPTQQVFGELPVRFDQQIGSNDRLTVRYFYDKFHNMGVNDKTNLLTYSDESNIGYHNALLSETHTFNSHIVNNFILSYQHEIATRGPLSGGISVADLGVKIWQPAFKQINQIIVNGGYFTVGDNPKAAFVRNNYTLKDDLHDLVGAHSFSFGVHAELSKMDIDNQFQQPGVFAFNGNNTNDPIASFLFGYLSSFTQASGQFLNLRGKFFGFYASDSWKLTRRLSLNLGLRYEPFYPWHEKMGRMGAFSPQAYLAGQHSSLYPNAPIGLVFAGDPGFLENGVPNSYSHLMPRFGFAWDILGTGKLSLRGGGGTFYDSRMNAILYNGFTSNSPFITIATLTNVQGQKLTFADPYGSYGVPNPFPAPQPPPHDFAFPVQNWSVFDPFNGFKTPIFYQWNLGTEYQVTRSLVAHVAYAGSHSSHLWTTMAINPVWNVGPNKGQRLYAPTYTGEPIAAANTGANSNYNSLQMSAEQRVSQGLTLLANYTWSKSLDNAPLGSGLANVNGTNYVYPIYEPNFRRLDYGPSEFDHRNVASVSYVYALPGLKDAPLAVRQVVNGWQTSGIVAFRSGDPLTVTSGSSDNSGSAQGSDRAVMIGSPYGGTACTSSAGVTNPRCKNYMNPASFTNNSAGTYGGVKKGSFVGPQYANWDVGVMKAFPFTEHTNLQFRAEFFDILNHTNFNDPTVANNSNFGKITGAGDPRIIQLSLKLNF